MSVIVWDEYPYRDSRYESWLTPVDWAVYAAAWLSKRARRNIRGYACLPHWRVFIVDPGNHNVTEISLVKRPYANPGIAPWIRLYRPIRTDQEMEWASEKHVRTENNAWTARVRVPFLDDFRTLVDNLKKIDRVMPLSEPMAYESLDILIDAAESNLVRPGSRHWVANAIAPILL